MSDPALLAGVWLVAERTRLATATAEPLAGIRVEVTYSAQAFTWIRSDLIFAKPPSFRDGWHLGGWWFVMVGAIFPNRHARHNRLSIRRKYYH